VAVAVAALKNLFFCGSGSEIREDCGSKEKNKNLTQRRTGAQAQSEKRNPEGGDKEKEIMQSAYQKRNHVL
jgi:hypothetical protein